MKKIPTGREIKMQNRIDRYQQVKKGWEKIGEKRYYFKSKWEKIYALYLEFLKKKKDIRDWYYESKTFIFPVPNGRGITHYTPDFCIVEKGGSLTYTEVKGWLDRKSKVKLNRMKKYYPGVKINLITKYEIREIQEKLGRLVGL